jgi:hypothetical protein
MVQRSGRLGLILCTAVLAAQCGPAIDLRTSLAVAEVFSGWYDNGVKDGKNHLLPSISFRLRNTGPHPVTNIRMTIGFWLDGGRELDSKEIQAIGGQALAPGATSDPVLVRGETGYTLEQPRTELFMHSGFQDATAKIFAKRSGQIVPIGEYRLDRQILPNVGPVTTPGAQ